MTEDLTFPLSEVTPDKTVMEFCCTTVAPILRYLQDRLGEDKTRALVRDSGMNWDYLQIRQHWVSFEYFCALLERGIEATGNERFPYDAALEFTDHTSMSFVGVCLLGALSVRQAYGLVAKWGGFWSKIHKSEILDSGSDFVIFRNSYPNHKQTRANCLAVQGSLSILPTYWGRNQADMEELSCCCNGDDACTYRIHWRESDYLNPLRVGVFLGAILGVVVLTLTQFSSVGIIGSIGLAFSGYLLGLVWRERSILTKLTREKKSQADSLLEALRRMEDFNRSLERTVQERTAALSAANTRLEETLSELHKSQQQAIEKERDAAIGVLAAGMAHELNSPINAIRLSTQALQEDMPLDYPDRHLLAVAERATARCRRMINDLLCFSRDKRMRIFGDIREAVVQAVQTFRDETNNACPVDIHIDKDLPKLTVDRAQIQQALSNLLVNAHDAMEGKGLIRVELKRDRKEGVDLIVADNGPGMEDARRSKIFEPFFSTKTEGRGLGIGLAISRQLFERNGATVEIETAVGKGTRFILGFAPRKGQDLRATQHGVFKHELT